MSINKTFLAIAVSALVGCGSGGGTDSTDVSVVSDTNGTIPTTGLATVDNGVGIYYGFLLDSNNRPSTVDASKGMDTIVLKFDPAGNNMMYVVISTIDGSAKFYEADTSSVIEIFSFIGYGSANIDETNNRITGSLSFGDEVVGDLDISFETKEDQNSTPIDINYLSDIYGRSVNGTSISIVIDVDGDITGSSADGCIFNGAATQLEATKNMFGVTLDISNCDDAGEYAGFTYLSFDDIEADRKYVSFTVFNNSNGYYFPLANL